MSRCFESLAQFLSSTVQRTQCRQMPQVQCGSDFSGRRLSPTVRGGERLNGFRSSHPISKDGANVHRGLPQNVGCLVGGVEFNKLIHPAVFERLLTQLR